MSNINPFRLVTKKEVIEKRIKEKNACKGTKKRVPKGGKLEVKTTRVTSAVVETKLLPECSLDELSQLLPKCSTRSSDTKKTSILKTELPFTKSELKLLPIERFGIRSFIAKKREMLMIELVLDSKRKETEKLEVITRKNSADLRKEKIKLENDIINNEKRMKENNKKTQNVLHHAEQTTKIKNEKIEEVKAMHLELSSLENSLVQLNERNLKFEKYKVFLSSLKSCEDSNSLCFTLPDELLEIFATMEDQILLELGQQQDILERAEAAKTNFNLLKSRTNTKVNVLRAEVEKLRKDLSRHDDCPENSSENFAKAINKLNLEYKTVEKVVAKICDSFELTYSTESRTKEGLLIKLQELEKLRADLIDKLSNFSEKQLQEKLKKREKERREQIRKEAIKEQAKLNEAKLLEKLEALKRANETNVVPVKKQKPVMFRSYLKQTRHVKGNSAKSDVDSLRILKSIKDVDQILNNIV